MCSSDLPEDAIKEAVRVLFRLGKLVVEPSGALGLAALLCSAVPAHGRIGIMISGGNIDDQCMTELLSAM